MHYCRGTGFVCLLHVLLCACTPLTDPATVHDKIFVFGTFSGTENGLDVVRTPAKEFGWLANDVKIQFVWLEGRSWPWLTAPVNKSGYFSAMLPRGRFFVNVRMPNRQVYLNHAFSAVEKGKAHYLGHLDLEITRRFVFLVLGVCTYGSVDRFSVSDELSTSMKWLTVDARGKIYAEVVKSLLAPTAEASAPSVDYDCGFLK